MIDLARGRCSHRIDRAAGGELQARRLRCSVLASIGSWPETKTMPLATTAWL